MIAMSRVFAYCRVSTLDQTTQNQQLEIKATGFAIEARRLIEETISGSVAAKQRSGISSILARSSSGWSEKSLMDCSCKKVDAFKRPDCSQVSMQIVFHREIWISVYLATVASLDMVEGFRSDCIRSPEGTSLRRS